MGKDLQQCRPVGPGGVKILKRCSEFFFVGGLRIIQAERFCNSLSPDLIFSKKMLLKGR